MYLRILNNPTKLLYAILKQKHILTLLLRPGPTDRAPASPIYSSGVEKDPEKLEAHEVFDSLRRHSPRGTKPIFTNRTMTIEEQSEELRKRLLPEKKPLKVYESEDHILKYDVASGKTKRKKRRKPKTKRKKHTKKRKHKKRKSTRKK